jgi:hypothetical protein
MESTLADAFLLQVYTFSLISVFVLPLSVPLTVLSIPLSILAAFFLSHGLAYYQLCICLGVQPIRRVYLEAQECSRVFVSLRKHPQCR